MGTTVKTIISTPPTSAPSFTTIGTVGSAGQIAAGHVLASGSFPSAAVGANLSWYMMNALTDASGNGRSLTNPNSAPLTGGDIFGNTSNFNFNGSSHYLASTDPLFDPGNTNFTCGGWFNPTSWTAGYMFLAQRDSASISWQIQVTANKLAVAASIDGTAVTYPILYDVTSFTGWHHVAIKYIASTHTFSMYIDGKLIGSGTIASNLWPAGTNRKFNIGSYQNGAGLWYAGTMDEFFFCSGTAFSDNAIAKIYASKYSHNLGLTSLNQKWYFIGTNSGQTRELYDTIVDMQPNDLYYDLSDESSTTQVAMIPVKIS